MTTRWIYRVDLIGLDSSGAATTFRYATQGYRTSPSHPTLPNTWFDGRLVQPLLLQRTMYGEHRTRGPSEIAHGTTIIGNADGGLDGLLSYAFDAQRVEMYRIDPAAPDTEILEFRGLAESFTLDENIVTVLVRDASYALDVPLQPTKYAGSNSLPNGLEGTADDIGGKPKPICYGACYNIEPVPVNTSRLIYQFHDAAYGAIASVKVYDSRISLAAGLTRPLSDFTSGATSKTVSSINTTTDVISFITPHGFSTGDPVHVDSTGTSPVGNTFYVYARAVSTTTITLHPTATDATNNTNIVDLTTSGSGTITVAKNRTPYGCFDYCNDASGSYVRLGSSPAGRVTMDATAAIYGSSYLPTKNLSNYLLARVGAIDGWSFSCDVSRLDTGALANAYGLGVYYREEISVYEALSQIYEGSHNATLQNYPRRGGSSTYWITLQQAKVPGSTATLDLDESTVLDGTLKLLQPQDEFRGIPPWRVIVGWRKNWTVMVPSEAPSTTAADIAFISSEFRTVVEEDATLKTQYPLAPELRVNSVRVGAVLDTSALYAFANYLQDLYGVTGRRMYSVSISMDLVDPLATVESAPLPGLLLGSVVKLTYPRFDLASGKYLNLLGATLDYQARTADLILWG